jgi:hypothetical protein
VGVISAAPCMMHSYTQKRNNVLQMCNCAKEADDTEVDIPSAPCE